MQQKIEQLTQKERVWVQEQYQNAVRFVEAFSPQDYGQPLTLASLDRAFAAWSSSDNRRDVELANDIINYVGVSFGQLLIEGLGFSWVIATDDQGSDLAVYALPRKGDVLIYPANFVAKRWERGETGFLEMSYLEIEGQIREILRNHKD